MDKQEPIDEEKLDKLAMQDLFPEHVLHSGPLSAGAKREIYLWKRGYKKAKDE